MQPPGVVTATFNDPPVAGMGCCSGAIAAVQPSAWLTVKVWPAMVRLPERGPPVFAAAVKVTAPFPVPVAPSVIESHDALLVDVQPHPAGAETFTDPFPPAAGTFWLGADSENEHPLPWVTVNVLSATETDPAREGPELDPTVSWTVPFPLPVPPEAIVIQGVCVDAVHPQPSAVCTWNDV